MISSTTSSKNVNLFFPNLITTMAVSSVCDFGHRSFPLIKACNTVTHRGLGWCYAKFLGQVQESAAVIFSDTASTINMNTVVNTEIHQMETLPTLQHKAKGSSSSSRQFMVSGINKNNLIDLKIT